MNLRKPLIQDVPAMTAIINAYATQGLMLARSRHHLYQTLRDFLVAEQDGQLIGCGALSLIWEDLAEIRSLAVDPAWRSKGVGRAIVQALMQEARGLGLPQVFALTYQAAFFGRLGFREVSKDTLPHKIWGDCLNCPKFPNCDETAMSYSFETQAEKEPVHES